MQKVFTIALFILILGSSSLRFLNLGYSEFQGDEISAQNYLFGEQNFSEFLVTRSVGPMQYVVSAIVNVFAFEKIENIEFFVRLPFAIANVLSIALVYLFSRKFFNENSAKYSAFFVSLSGLFLAFGRIVQYQSFIILLAITTVFAFSLFIRKGNHMYLIVSGLLSGLAVLFHYDAATYIIPIVVFLLIMNLSIKQKIASILYFGVPSILLASIFYIPFVLNPIFKTTFTYLFGERISSGFGYDSVFYSVRLFSIYHPKEFSILVLISIFLSIFLITRKFNAIVKILTSTLILLIVIRYVVSTQNSFLHIASTILAAALLFLFLTSLYKSKKATVKDFVLVWFMFSFTCYGIFFSVPLTHIYTFLLPMYILISYYASEIKSHTTSIAILFIIVGTAGISHNYQAFIDNNVEYPWSEKHYIFGKMNTLVSSGAEVRGIFGFPYNRGWKRIAKDAESLGISTYNSNEKYRLTKYYMREFKWKDTGNEIFIWVRNPQSLDKQLRPDNNVLYQTWDYSIVRVKF